MRIAILTDIHANREAMEACLEHAAEHGAEQYAFLGDIVGYGADPAWVMEQVIAYCAKGAIAVLGNHDEAVVNGVQEGMRADPRKVVEWTRAHMSAEHIDFLSKLPYKVERGNTLFVHANAHAPKQWGYIESVVEASRSMFATQARVTFCGHVHNPTLYHLSATGKLGVFNPVPDNSIHLSPQRKWLAIPGAVGQPRDGNPAACYAIFDEQSGELTYYRVAYDYDTTAQKIRAADLPQNLANRLSVGE